MGCRLKPGLFFSGLGRRASVPGFFQVPEAAVEVPVAAVEVPVAAAEVSVAAVEVPVI